MEVLWKWFLKLFLNWGWWGAWKISRKILQKVSRKNSIENTKEWEKGEKKWGFLNRFDKIYSMNCDFHFNTLLTFSPYFIYQTMLNLFK